MLSIEEVSRRADLLWQRHKQNGGYITKAEVEQVLGIGFQSAYNGFKKVQSKCPNT